MANEVRRQNQKKSRPGLRRASIRETQKQRRVRKINHTPAPPTSTTQTISRRPSLYLPGQNSIIEIASRGQSRCVWRSLLRIQGVAWCEHAAPPRTGFLCLSIIIHEPTKNDNRFIAPLGQKAPRLSVSFSEKTGDLVKKSRPAPLTPKAGAGIINRMISKKSGGGRL